MEKYDINRKYGKGMWRVRLPTKDGNASASVCIYPTKKYGEFFGYELIEKYKSEQI